MDDITRIHNLQKLKGKTMEQLNHLMDTYNLHPYLLPVWENGTIEEYNEDYRIFCCNYLSTRIILK